MVIFLVLLQEVEEVEIMEAEEDMVEVADSLMVVVDLLNQVEMADSLMVVVEDLLNQVEVAVVEDIEVGLVEGLMTLVEMTDSLVILDPQPHSNTADNKVDTADNTVDNQYNNTSGNKVLNQVEVADHLIVIVFVVFVGNFISFDLFLFMFIFTKLLIVNKFLLKSN